MISQPHKKDVSRKVCDFSCESFFVGAILLPFLQKQTFFDQIDIVFPQCMGTQNDYYEFLIFPSATQNKNYFKKLLNYGCQCFFCKCIFIILL
jgi:hypothetical protein